MHFYNKTGYHPIQHFDKANYTKRMRAVSYGFCLVTILISCQVRLIVHSCLLLDCTVPIGNDPNNPTIVCSNYHTPKPRFSFYKGQISGTRIRLTMKIRISSGKPTLA